MKTVVKPECRHGCTFLQISNQLWLCPHASYGAGSYLKGAVEEARQLLERAGGYDAVLDKINKAKEAKRQAARAVRAQNPPRVKYDR